MIHGRKIYFLIRWIEEQPNWDVLAKEDIFFPTDFKPDEKEEEDFLGMVVDAKWQNETSPAKILRFSCKLALSLPEFQC